MAEKQSNPSLKLAIAMAVLRARRHATDLSQKTGSATTAVSEPVVDSDVHRWKRKAKERKVQLLKMREDLKEAEDALRHDVFTHNAPCKCFFFNDLGKSSVVMVGDDSDDTFNDVLRRRFLRQVRFNERKRRKHDCLISKWRPLDTNIENDEEKLRAAVDFIVNLCDNTSCARLGEDYFANWAHQAVDFIIVSLKKTMSSGKNNDVIEVTVNSLITRLLRTMCFPLKKNDLYEDGVNAQFYIQHLIRKLGSNSLLGHHTMLLVCERISTLGESLLFMDPLEDSFVDIHSSMFLLMELIEFLVLDYAGASWSGEEGSTKVMEEEWVASAIHTRDGLKMTESRNILYILYMDRVVGVLGHKLGHFE